MRIEPQYLDCTAFLCTPNEYGELKPSGTAFIVAVPDEDNSGSSFDYLVTARHCITDAGDVDITVRINTERLPFKNMPESVPGYVDEATRGKDWWKHKEPTADVAAMPISEERRNRWPRGYWKVPIGAFIDREYKLRTHQTTLYGEDINEVSRRLDGYTVAVGDDVFFTGLFVKSHGTKRNLPIARFGSISRTPGDELIPVATESGRRPLQIRGYLVECRSWGGHSGSPVFWRPFFNPPVDIVNAEGQRDTAVQKIGYFNALLGLVSGHFPMAGKVVDLGDGGKHGKRRRKTEDLWAQMNAGIAVVTPAEAIRELLMRDDRVMEDRRRRSAERQRRALRENAAVFDQAGSGPPMQTTHTGHAVPVPARGALLSDLKKATRKRKPSRRG